MAPETSETETPPEQPQGRTLAVLLDGTSNSYAAKNTNVAKLFQMLDKDDTSRQLCYYQPGVGTYTSPSLITPITRSLAMVADLGVAWYISAHITGAYQFICDNWQQGDKICIFGFSRGAYTARALAGMIEKIGLISARNPEMLNFAWSMYTKTDKPSIVLAKSFKATFARDAQVDFLGVWDTVSSVGGLISRHFPYTATNQSIKVFRHAIALDEHRVKFAQNKFHETPPDEVSASKDPEYAGYVPGTPGAPISRGPARDRPETDWEEVYFAGYHSSVGGGDYKNEDPIQSSNITLRWMLTKILEKPECGLVFDAESLAEFQQSFLAQNYAFEDHVASHNINSRLYDQLWNFTSLSSVFVSAFWWLLEFIPFKRSWQDPVTKVWHNSWVPHYGRARLIAPDAKIHISVKDRMATSDYRPRPKLPAVVNWVDE